MRQKFAQVAITGWWRHTAGPGLPPQLHQTPTGCSLPLRPLADDTITVTDVRLYDYITGGLPGLAVTVPGV